MNSKKLLILLLFILGLLLGYRVLFSEDQKTVPLKYTKGTVSTLKKEGGTASLTLRTELLNQEPPSSLAETKNIFAPLTSPKPPPPPVITPPPPPPPPPLLPPPEIRGPTPEELALAQARNELTEFRYIGFLDRGNGVQEGFFTRRQEAVLAKKGEVLFGHFMIKELSGNLAVIEETATHAEVTLQLSEGRSER